MFGSRDKIQSKVEDFKFSWGELGIGEINYCLEGAVSLVFRSGAQGSMKGKRSEAGCCHTVIGERKGDLHSSRRSANLFL